MPCIHRYPITPATLHLPASIRLSTAAAVMALLLGYGVVTLPKMLLQPPASNIQSPLHFSRQLPNALGKCSQPEQTLNSQGPQTIMILTQIFFFFPSVNANLSFCSSSPLNWRYRNHGGEAGTCFLDSHKDIVVIVIFTLFPIRFFISFSGYFRFFSVCLFVFCV